jgi:hypothetical protein
LLLPFNIYIIFICTHFISTVIQEKKEISMNPIDMLLQNVSKKFVEFGLCLARSIRESFSEPRDVIANCMRMT